MNIIIFWVRGLCMCEYKMKCREECNVCMCVMDDISVCRYEVYTIVECELIEKVCGWT